MLLWMVVLFGILYPFYMVGALGAGDVKLYCMAAAFLRGKECLVFLAGSMVIAAAVILCRLLYKRSLKAWRKGLHMAGPMLVGFLLHVCGIY